MSQEEAQSYVKTCIHGEPPPCAAACPFELDVRDFMSKVERGRLSGAFKTYRNAVVFPAIVAELCAQPCKDACTLGKRLDSADGANAPIEMKAIETSVLESVKKQGADFFAIPPKPQKVAVVGANMSGLACALSLAQKQYQVTVFEPTDSWGGSLRNHEKWAVFDADITAQFGAVTVTFRFGETFNDTLRGEFDAVYVAVDESDPIREIALGKRKAIELEIYMQTGKTVEQGEVGNNLTQSAATATFSEADASAEAARCEKCDCNACLNACPMLGKYKKEPTKLAMEAALDSHVNPPLSTHVLTRQAYACSDCGGCKSVCPQGIDLGRLFAAYRKMRVANGTAPKAFHEVYLRQMREFNERGRVIASTTAPRPASSMANVAQGEKYVFFPGCALATELKATTELVYEWLKINYGAGLLERCCGSPAKWAGEPEFGELHFEQGATIIYACPSCRETLIERFPNLKLKSVYELLTEQGVTLPDGIAERSYTLFHACSARDNATLRTAVEKQTADLTIRESLLNCCAYGGQTELANRELYVQTAAERAALSDAPYLVYCANCKAMFNKQGKAAAHLLELLFPANNESEGVKMLTISDVARKTMQELLISETDVLKVIQSSETSGGYFESDAGTRIGSDVGAVLTYWVEYKPRSEGGFEVVSAYYHRMRFRDIDEG
jgi:Fe-S oxidoreductase